MKNILYVIAMEKEAKGIVKKLELEKVEGAKLKIYEKGSTRLLITGIGKQRVAMNLAIYMENYEKPDIIINLGYAGSTNSEIGTWVNVSEIYNYEWEIPGEEKYTMDGIDNKELIVKVEDEKISKLPCYTAEKFVTGTTISEDVLFDMELHSIYLICCIHGIKLLSLKKVSDNLSLDNYYENIDIESLMELTSGLEYCKMYWKRNFYGKRNNSNWWWIGRM